MKETLTRSPRDKLHTIEGRLFQARLWREYAMTWHGRKAFGRLGNDWVIGIGRHSYQE